MLVLAGSIQSSLFALATRGHTLFLSVPQTCVNSLNPFFVPSLAHRLHHSGLNVSLQLKVSVVTLQQQSLRFKLSILVIA